MTEKIRLAPVAGGRVRKPDGSLLAEAGEIVVRDRYWDRRLAHCDVVPLPIDDRAEDAPEVTGKTKGEPK